MNPLLNGARFASVIFDVDSTLAAIEGVDWLAALRSAAVASACADLTARAMAGEMPLEEVYELRLRAIVPTVAEIAALGEAYRHAVQPGAGALIDELREVGCEVHMVSGGLRSALLPLARDLGISPDRLHAVSIIADEAGHLVALHGAQPLATQQGKAKVLSELKLPRPSVMIGDGATDAAARGVVDSFIAYTGVARRLAVVNLADAEAPDFASLHDLLFE